jgi:hypothetical protein
MLNRSISALLLNLFLVTIFNSFSHITHIVCTCLFQDIRKLFTPLTDEDETLVDSSLYGSGHKYTLGNQA